MTLRILVATSDDDVECINRSVSTNDPMYFAAPQDSEPGDTALIFTHGHLVARAEISSTPDDKQFFRGRPVYRAWVANFVLVDPPTPIDEVRREMPETWLWPTHPRRSFCTPRGDHAGRLVEIVERALASRVNAPTREETTANGHGDDTAPNDVIKSELEQTRHESTRIGYESDPAVRKAVEGRAMAVAEEHYRAQGFLVENTASRRPYDLRCTRAGLEVRVEVKGTRGDGAKVEVTIGEVLNARSKQWRTDLFVLREIGITWENSAPVGIGGRPHIIEGWQPEDDDLEAIRFRCTVSVPPLDGGPEIPTDPTRLEVFTIGQKGVASPTSFREVVTRLGIAHIVDAREEPPTRGAWSRAELAKLLGQPLVAIPRGADPAVAIAALTGRILLFGMEKDPFETQAVIDFGDQHPEWDVVHILHQRHVKSPVGEAECIAHRELAAAIRDRPNKEYRFFDLDAYSIKGRDDAVSPGS